MFLFLLDTGKWILSAIVDSKNKDLAFFIGADAQRTINAKLQAIAAPHDMERKPRSLEYIKRGKGKSSANSKDHYYYMKWNNILSFIVFASQYRILRVHYNILIDCEHVKFTYMNCELWCEVVVKLKPEKTSGLYWSTYLCDTGAVLSLLS